MGQEDTCKQTNAEDGLVKFSSLVEEENVKVSVNDFVDFDVNGGNGISEGVANVEKDMKSGISRIKDNEDVKRSDEIVGVKGIEIKSGEIPSVECGGEKSCEIVDGDGDGNMGGSEDSGFVGNCRISGDTLTIDSDGTKSSEKVSDGENGDSESESEASSESESEASSESDSEVSSESESETSSPSLSLSSSEEEDNDDDNEGELKEKAHEEGEVDVNGMIEDLIVRELFDWSDEEEEFAKAGLFMSANEVKVLPPVPPVAVTLQPCHETLPVGVVLSVVGAQVIVEGAEKHDPLNEGSILWITEKRCPLGIVDEIFGPVKNPYYIVRYNSDNEVPVGIQQGTLISFVSEFVNHVLNNGNLYKKGYDASGENDEELSDEAEFSDDEKEAEYQRMQNVSKRGPKAQIVKNRKDTKNKAKRRGEQHLSATQPNKRVGQVPSNQSHHFPPSSLLDPGNYSNSFRPVQAFPGGPGFVPMFPQATQVPDFVAPSSGVWMNGIPFQPPQSMGFLNGSPYNILQLQQNYAQQHYQMLSVNGMPLQQQFSTGQMLPSNFVLPGGQPSFGVGATFTPMNPMMMGQNNFGQLHATISQNNFSQAHAAINMQGQNAINMQGQHGVNFSQAQTPVVMQGQHVPAFISQGEQGVLLTGCQSEQNSNSQPLYATSASSGGSQDFSNAVGVGLARNSHRKGGGRFGGGRGRRKSRLM